MRHLILINKGYLDAIFRFYTVCAVCIVEETEFDTIDILDERHLLLTVGHISISADMINAERVETDESAARPLIATVETMVVGSEEHIETCIFESLGIRVGGREAGVA